MAGEAPRVDGLKLRPLTPADMETVRRWRNDHLEGLRTPYPLTREQQEQFYKDVICNRDSQHRYWAVEGDGLVGMVGLTYIQWENRLAEISLITDPYARKRGIGSDAVKLALEQAFGNMGLLTVYGECYECNPACGFWHRMTERYHGVTATLPRRKFWHGKLWDSLYFSIDADGFAGGVGSCTSESAS